MDIFECTFSIVLNGMQLISVSATFVFSHEHCMANITCKMPFLSMPGFVNSFVDRTVSGTELVSLHAATANLLMKYYH